MHFGTNSLAINEVGAAFAHIMAALSGRELKYLQLDLDKGLVDVRFYNKGAEDEESPRAYDPRPKIAHTLTAIHDEEAEISDAERQMLEEERINSMMVDDPLAFEETMIDFELGK